ncbi:MAG: hypothetical protein ABIJ09_06550 [Pseudomonadota bacterium]
MTAPNSKKAVSALKAMQNLPADVLDTLITDEVGDDMLGVFVSLAEALGFKPDNEMRPRAVHLMVLAYLMRAHAKGELEL